MQESRSASIYLDTHEPPSLMIRPTVPGLQKDRAWRRTGSILDPVGAAFVPWPRPT